MDAKGKGKASLFDGADAGASGASDDKKPKEKVPQGPTKKELRDSTVVVLIATAILGSYIALIDFSLMNGVELLTSWVK